jgi:hypothetical protein
MKREFMGANSAKNRAACRRSVCLIRDYNTDPRRLARREDKEGKRYVYYEKIRSESFLEYFIIEKSHEVKLTVRSCIKPTPQKMNKFHREDRGKKIFFISQTVWNKYKTEVLKTIEDVIFLVT